MSWDIDPTSTGELAGFLNHQSKKSPTGPTERTPKPENLTARSQLPKRGPLGFGPIQLLIESTVWLGLKVWVERNLPPGPRSPSEVPGSHKTRCTGRLGCMVYLLPRNLTWNLKMMVSKRNFLFWGLLFRFHVKFRGCTYIYHNKNQINVGINQKSQLNVAVDKQGMTGRLGYIYVYIYTWNTIRIPSVVRKPSQWQLRKDWI